MKKALLLIGISISGNLIAQSSLNNFDFEDGNLNHWIPDTGMSCTGGFPDCYIVGGIGTNSSDPDNFKRHLLINTPGMDPSVPVSVLSPFRNSQYSLRLGNELAGYGAERITYRHTFAADDTLLNVFFAAILQAPGHPIDYDPFFKIEVLDTFGNVVPSSIDLVLTDDTTLQGGSIRYKDWTRYIFYDPSFVGGTYDIRFTNSDCDYGGHWARAYLDVNKETQALRVLNDSLGYRVQAPGGYVSYQWSTGVNDTLDYLMSPPNGMIYCTVTSANNITMTYSAFIMGTTAVDEHVEINNQFLLYPNPANNILNVKTQEEGSASIFDISGNLVKTLNYKGNSSFDISNLDNGNYIIRFFTNNGVVLESKSLKVVK